MNICTVNLDVESPAGKMYKMHMIIDEVKNWAETQIQEYMYNNNKTPDN